MLRVLIVCESSGVVREAFRRHGHEAWSCSKGPADDGSPYHLNCDATEAISKGSWSLVIMHPPCTYLTTAGIHWNNRGRGWPRTEEALEFVRCLMSFDVPWCLENPMSIISSRIRPPDQYIQPYNFGEDASKNTGLWLHSLPLLKSTCCFPPRIVEWKGKLVKRWSNQLDSGQNREAPHPLRWKTRSKTEWGVADAMAKQWGAFLMSKL